MVLLGYRECGATWEWARMLSGVEIEKIIMNALIELNRTLGADEQFEATPDVTLLGVDSPLDSLGFVSLLSDIETELGQRTGRPVSLMDDRALARAESPYQTPLTLTKYVAELLSNA